MDLINIWNLAQEEIRTSVGDTSYETWFNTIKVEQKDINTLIIKTPDQFFQNWIIEHYQTLIESTICKTTKQTVILEFAVDESILNKETQCKLNQFEQGFKEEKSSSNNKLNERFTFDQFVIGSSNRFACAAGLAVAESPAKAYNPLLFYGQVGLGKTHLVQAITHKLQEIHPRLKHCYLSSEQFTNELIDAIRTRSTNTFRKKYREMDVLLIDDIQFIAGKESTQEEFFHTFNYLHDNKKQIILTSDRPPKEISNLEERLISRFAWGLIADIQPPDYETRVAILIKKVENEPVKVPMDVIHFIAEQIKTNIRELEGALIRVIAYALLDEKPITLEMTKSVLKDMVKETTKIITIEMIQKCVSGFYNVTIADLKTKRRTKNLVVPRQIAMYLSRKLTNMSFPEIGSAFGGKDHTTVLHSCRKIDNQLKEDASLKNVFEELITALKQ